MKTLTLSSPAKLNLYLKVINKRKDGFHNIKTLFERIDLCDTLQFSNNRTGRIRITCRHPHVPKGPKNLVYQVAQQFKKQYGVASGVDVKILKRIPVAAGLAGGSSNAAATLLALNKLWKLNLSGPKLAQWGGQIGSDVPFFLNDCSWALGTGRGDLIKKVKIPTKLWHILVVPRIKLYSREVFTELNLQLTKRGDNATILIHHLKSSNILEIESLLLNDLETSILKICPRLRNVKKRLQGLHLNGVAFSGSGPSVFGITQSKKKAQEVCSVLKKRYSQVFVVQTL